MRAPGRLAAYLVGAPLLFVSLVTVSAQAKDLQHGTWVQNLDKSACVLVLNGARCDPPPKVPTTRTFEDLGNGFIYVTNDGVNAEGTPTGNRIVYRRDGRDYPIAARGQQDYVTISFVTKSMNPFATEYVTKIDGEISGRSMETISADGRTYTTTTRGNNARGQAFTNVTVFEKVTPSTN